ncbi:MAG TPA: methyltransferase domain-containing protein [Verrucomicrobiae bacterium]|nr:methyltransferase domain-containing protein [Verrucomicrobiae bacterium]
MFLKQRALQAEYFDELDRPPAEIADGYAMLGRVNRFFSFTSPFQHYLPKMLGEERCRSLSLLDLGAGDGSLGDELSRWATGRGWEWRFINLDLNQQAMRLNPGAKWVAASALRLPFCDQAFDVVVASQMTHHLISEEDACLHFQEAWRVTRQALLLNDLHRNVVLYSALWVLLRLFRFPEHFRNDGLLSVQRSWRVGEWRALAKNAGIPNARVWLYGGARLMLEARRESAKMVSAKLAMKTA